MLNSSYNNLAVYRSGLTSKLQVNTQHPNRLTKLIMIKCFLGRLKPLDFCLYPSIVVYFLYAKERVYLLLTKCSLYSSLDPLFHSDNVLNLINAKEMNAFPYYTFSEHREKNKNYATPYT